MGESLSLLHLAFSSWYFSLAQPPALPILRGNHVKNLLLPRHLAANLSHAFTLLSLSVVTFALSLMAQYGMSNPYMQQSAAPCSLSICWSCRSMRREW